MEIHDIYQKVYPTSTSHFRAPKFWVSEKYDREVDVFSFSGF